MIAFAQYSISQLSIELRFDNAFLLWDRAGSIGEFVKRTYEDVEVVDASPGKITFDLERRFKIIVSLDRASIIDHRPPTQIDSEIDKTDKIFSHLIKQLEITKIKRVGTRVLYDWKAQTQDDAAKMLLAGSRFNFDEEKIFGVERGVVRPGIIFVSEDASLGYRFSVGTHDREASFNPPLNTPEIAPQKSKISYSQIDIDLYTTAPIESQALNLRGWLERVRRAINRDADKILKKI